MTTLSGPSPARLERTNHKKCIRDALRLVLGATLIAGVALFVLVGALPDDAGRWPAIVAATLIGLGTLVFGTPLRLARLLGCVKLVDLSVFSMLVLLAAIIRVNSDATWPAWVLALLLLVRVAGAVTRKVIEWRR